MYERKSGRHRFTLVELPVVSRRKRAAFTLVELLIVIAIIALLAGLLIPTVNLAIRKAEEATAKGEVQSIKHAVLAYQAEYSKFPDYNGETGDKIYAEPQSNPANPKNPHNEDLFNVLRDLDKSPNTNHKLNRKRVIFLEPNETSLDGDNMVDPWGNQYVIAIDTDFDNICEGLPGHGDITNQTVAVYSLGLDPDSDDDDLTSWE